MGRGFVIAAIGLAACGGPARTPVAEAEEPVHDMRRPPADPGPIDTYGGYDEAGRPDGDWTFDCDGIAGGCRAWFEHGTQVTWSRLAGAERYVIDAHERGWRWQWWYRDVLRGEVELAFAPGPWKPHASVLFPEPGAPLDDGNCKGRFVLRTVDGTLTATGTCDNGRWTEWINYGAQGEVVNINRRTPDGADIQTLDGAGLIVARTQTAADGTTTDERWFPDGTPQWHVVQHGTTVLENRVWYPNGKLAHDDVTAGDTRTLRRYAESGRLVASATWRAELRVGTWRTWYDGGARRSQVTFDATTGAAKGPLVVWSPRGKRVGTADLDTMAWTDRKRAVPTHVVSVRAPAGIATVELDGQPACQATDDACLRDRIAMMFSPAACLGRQTEDLLAIWRGRITITLGFERNAISGVLAIRDPGGLGRDQRDCLVQSAPAKQFSQQVDVVLEVDLLTPPDDNGLFKPDLEGDPLLKRD